MLFKTSIKLCCLVHLKNVCNTLLVLAYVVVFKIGGWLEVLTKLSVICMTYMYYIIMLCGIILLGAGSWETEPLKGINEDDGTAKLGSLECMVH